MKKYLCLVIFCAVALISIPPLLGGKSSNGLETGGNTSQTEENQSHIIEKSTQNQDGDNDTITVFLSAQNKNVEMNLFEYVCGSVAAEMPLAYSEEAIKAQAVACYTNALRLKKESSEGGAHISDNIKIHQGYIDENARREKWGDEFSIYEEKLKNAVKSVEGKTLQYNGELCVAAFFAISCGTTESAENLWGSSVPYLTSVTSEGDILSPKYSSTVTFDAENTLKNLTALGVEESKINKDNPLTVTKTSPSGTVLECAVGDKTFTGEEIRSAFSLRSPVFTLTQTQTGTTFNVRGYGHGVVMSQYGADYFAKQGYSYEDILKHYYKGAEII